MAPVDTASLAEFLANPDRLQTIRYELNMTDYTKAFFSHPTTKRQLWITFLLGVFILLVALLEAMASDAINAVVTAIIGVTYVIFVRHWLKSRIRKQMLSIGDIFAEPIELSYGPSAIAHKSANTFSYMQRLYRVVRTKEYRLLGHSDQSFFIVPVRAFESPLALAEFDNTVGQLAQGRVVGK